MDNRNNYLYHWGILGMKWGVRRSGPGSTGLLKGRKLGQPIVDKTASVVKKTSAVKKASTNEPVKKKKVSELSDDELQQKINRLRMEKEYRELNNTINSQKTSKGQKFAMDAIEKIGMNTITNLGTQATNHLVGNAINKAAGVDSSDATKRVVNPQKGQSDKK